MKSIYARSALDKLCPFSVIVMVLPLWLYVPVPSFASAWSSIKSPASNLMLFAILMLTRASICAATTAVVPLPGGDIDIVGCE